VQLVAHKAGESILCVRGGYAALHKLLWWYWGERTYCLIFLLYMSAKFKIGVFLLRDTMLAPYTPLLCVHLSGVDVEYWQLSDWTHLQWAL